MYDATSNKFDPYNYAAYLKAKASAGRRMVYVGANDGMLHGFNATSGVEQFAYIPQTALGHMGNLLFPTMLLTKITNISSIVIMWMGQLLFRMSHLVSMDGPRRL